MKGYKTKDIMTPGYEMPTTREGLEAVYRTLAKAADERMVRLEKAAARGGDANPYANVKEWAYRRGARDIEQWSGAREKSRFNVKPPEAMTDLEAKIEDIKTFLSLKTSTVQGIKESFQHRANELNKAFGTSFKWNDMAEYFESDLAEEMDKHFGSDTKFFVLAELQKNKKKILRSIEKSKKINIKVPDEMVNMLVQDTIENFGPQVAEYLKKIK